MHTHAANALIICSQNRHVCTNGFPSNVSGSVFKTDEMNDWSRQRLLVQRN